jgi:hypothetical protein
MPPKNLIIAGSAFGAVLLAFWGWREVASRMRYVIGRDSFRVMLGERTLRRILYSDIERVHKPYRELRWTETENWRTSRFDRHRVLVLERKTGFFRKFVITPKHRYEMRSQLREAIAKSTGRAMESVAPEFEDDTDLLERPSDSAGG